MTEQQKIVMEQICRAMVDHFHYVDTTVEEVQEWMKIPANCAYLIQGIADLHNILYNKEIS